MFPNSCPWEELVELIDYPSPVFVYTTQYLASIFIVFADFEFVIL